MREVEKIRLAHGLTKTAVAQELRTTVAVLRFWTTRKSIGRAESIARIREFIKR
jgi:DNA-binding transcriptional regulator YiaG